MTGAGRLDPYLAWTLAGGWQGHAAVRGDADAAVLLLVETADELLQPWPGFAARRRLGDSPYATVAVRRGDVASLAAAIAEAGGRCEFALPVAGLGTGAVAAPPAPPPAAPLVLAVVDHGCAFLQRSFRRPGDPSRTRLLGLWMQGGADVPAAGAPLPDFGYGRELTAAAIDALIARAGTVGEAAVYREQGVLQVAPGLVAEAAHGTHVLDLLGGPAEPRRQVSVGKPDHVDGIGALPLVFVDLPTTAPGDSTGASSSAYLLDALHYVRRRAGAGVPVLLNVSLGALAGPHDGSSLTEQAIDDFLQRDGCMALTLAAGNAARESWHAHGVLARRTDDAALLWRLRADDPTDSFAELWFQGASAALASVSLRLVDPLGRASAWQPLADGEAVTTGAALYTRAAGSIGKDAMALAAVAPNAGARRAAPAGVWRIEIRRDAAGGAVRFDAWIQRDEPDGRGGTPVQSRFEAVRGQARLDGGCTLSNLATGQRGVVVGALDRQEREAAYSSRGAAAPSARSLRDVDVLAPAERADVAGGLLGAGVHSGTLVRLGGTSVASPVAARRIAQALLAGRIVPAAGTSLADAVRHWLLQRPAQGPAQRPLRRLAGPAAGPAP